MTTTTTNAHDVLTAFGTAPVAPPKRPRCRVKDDAFNWVLVGIAQRVTAHIEQGIDVDQLEQLAKVFGVLPSTLVPDGEDNLRGEVAASVTAAMVEHGQTPERLPAPEVALVLQVASHGVDERRVERVFGHPSDDDDG